MVCVNVKTLSGESYIINDKNIDTLEKLKKELEKIY